MTLTVNDGYITLAATSAGTGYLRQQFEKELNGIYTLAVMVRGTGTGNLYFSKDGASVGAGTISFQATEQWTLVTGILNTAAGTSLPNQFSISVDAGKSVDVMYVMLLEGEYTIETLPEYQPKGYAVELAECRRYYRRKENAILPGFVNGSVKGITVNVENDGPFHAIPTFNITSIYWIRGGGKNITTIPAWTISTYSNNLISPVYSIDFAETIDQTVYANVYVYCHYELVADL